MALINIKGVNNSLVFVFEKGSYEDYIAFLQKRLQKNHTLFQGAMVSFKGDALNSLAISELASIQKLCLDQGMILKNIEQEENSAKPIINNKNNSSGKIKNHDLIIHKNVRSGQKVESKSSVIIWGDVHESAEIIAGNDIIVLGKLKGNAHAGANGDLNSIVFALSMSPGQLRIGDLRTYNPNDILNNYPEVAYVDKTNNICVEPYKAKNTLARWGMI